MLPHETSGRPLASIHDMLPDQSARDLVPITTTGDEPMTALTDVGVRVPVASAVLSAQSLAAKGFTALHPGQRVLARIHDGAVAELAPISVDLMVHQKNA